MASKTYIYRDMVSGCEMFSVAHPHSLMAGNDAVLCVQSAMINENGDTIDVGKDILRYGRNTRPDLILWSFHLGARIRKAPRTLWMDFLDHDFL